MKNNFKGFALFVVSICLGLILFQTRQSARGPASVDSFEDQFEKAQLIRALSFSDYGPSAKLSLYADQADLCSSWNSLEVTFRSEGIAYSGEPDRVIQKADCSEGGFQQDWPTNLMEETYGIERVGYFMEAPDAWVVESVKLNGPAGLRVMSGNDIYKQTGRVPLVQQAR